jgi:hypothetical protein
MAGLKFDKNKAKISLIPREAIEEEAKALAFGAEKYGKYNYREGIAYSRLIDSALRHILALADGEDIDQESGCNHAANARANLGMLIFMMSKKPEMDDRYKTQKLPTLEEVRNFVSNARCPEEEAAEEPGVLTFDMVQKAYDRSIQGRFSNDIVMGGSKK